MWTIRVGCQEDRVSLIKHTYTRFRVIADTTKHEFKTVNKIDITDTTKIYLYTILFLFFFKISVAVSALRAIQSCASTICDISKS